MKLIDILNSPWMIEREKYREIKAVYETHLRGEKIDFKAFEAKYGPINVEKQNSYEVLDGVAIIPLHGIIAKKMNLFTNISGGCSSEMYRAAFTQAIIDPDVSAIIQWIDSPGGTVDGSFETSDMVFRGRKNKRIISYVDGLGASAACLIGSAAHEVYLSSPVTMTGSLGVVSVHSDVSERNKREGVVETEITSGTYKRIASSNAPLTKEGKEYLQEQSDFVYSQLIDSVATYRGFSVEKVLNDMSDGRIFIGSQAVDNGLVDGISTLDEIIAKLSKKSSPSIFLPGAAIESSEVVNSVHLTQKEDIAMSENGSYIAPPVASTAGIDASAAERQRIKDVRDQLIPGHEALINELMFDGKTTGPEAAVKVLAAEKVVREKSLSALNENPLKPFPAAAMPDTSASTDKNLPVEARCKNKWEKDSKLQDEFFHNFNAYVAYSRAMEVGCVRFAPAAHKGGSN